jgi:hypothetical protein
MFVYDPMIKKRLGQLGLTSHANVLLNTFTAREVVLAAAVTTHIPGGAMEGTAKFEDITEIDGADVKAVLLFQEVDHLGRTCLHNDLVLGDGDDQLLGTGARL